MQITLNGIAVVTGGGQGIGAAIARGLADAGADVIVVDQDEASAEASAQAVGGQFFVCDVTDKAAVEETAQRIQNQFGPVRYLVNNAGIVARPGHPFTEIAKRTGIKPLL